MALTLKDLGNSLQNLFNQGVSTVGNAVSQDFQRVPIVQGFNNLQRVVQTPQIQQGISDLPASTNLLFHSIPGAINTMVMNPQQAGNLARTAPNYAQIKVPGMQTLANFSANAGQTFGQGLQNMAMGVNRVQNSPGILNKTAGVFQTIGGAGQTLAPFTAWNQVPNFLSSLPQSNAPVLNQTQRLSAGIVRGMAGDNTLSPNVKNKNLIDTKILGQDVKIDPFEQAGQMLGFVKNPINNEFFKLTDKILPTGNLLNKGTNIKKWVAVNGFNGSVQQLFTTMGQMPENATDAQKIAFMAQNAAIGAGMNIGGRALTDTGSKAVGKVINSKLAVNAYNELKDLIRKLNTPVATMEFDANGNRIVKPLWKYQLEQQGGGLSVKDVNKMSVEDYKKIPSPQQPLGGVNVSSSDTLPKSTLLPLSQEALRLDQSSHAPNIGLSGQGSSPLSISQDVKSGKVRGLTSSVQETPNVIPNVKAQVIGTYIPKKNLDLMGEAQALLQEGASIDLKNTKNIDQKVAATIKEAISQQKKNPQLAANLFNNLSEKATELGRGVQAFSMLDKMSPEAIALSAAGKIKKYNATATRKIPELTGDQVQMIADKVAALSKLKVGSREHNIAVNELSNTINSFIPSSIADKAITVWKAGLLTSLRTHERNLLGNTIMSAAEVAKDFIASPVDRLLALKTGKRSLVFNTQGTGQGIREGLTSAKDIIQKGYDPEATISKFDQKTITWGNNPFEQALKKGTDAVFRTLGAEDKPFLKGAYARSLYDQAKVAALNAGKARDQGFIQNLVAKPTKQMIETAGKEADYATFHDKTLLSSMANAIKRTASDPKYGIWSNFGKAVTEIVAPFTGVPSSIVGKTIDYSPLGLAKGAVNVGRVLTGHVPELQRQAAQEIGRGVIGTGLFGLGAYLMSQGLMTGQPKDTTEANLWATQGKQANSVLIGGKWRSINSIGPQNLVMLAGAKYQEQMGNGGNLGAYAGALGKDQLSQTFLAGVQGPLNAITDPARYGSSYIGNQSASLVPNIIKDTSKAFDPNQRENNSIQDYFTNSIPGLRNQNVPKRDVLGNIMPQEPTGAGAYFDLLNSKTPINNTITNELNRLNSVGNDATPSKLNKSQTILKQKVKLNPQELNNFEAGSGQMVQQQLNDLINSTDYKALTDEEKAKAIDNTVSNIRTMYKNTNQIQGNTSTVPTNTSTTATIGKDNKILYTDNGKLKTFDLNPPTTGQGIKAFVNSNWKIQKAIDAWDSNLPQQYKDQVYKQMGVDPQDVRYASLAKNNTDVSTQYIISKSPNHQTLLNNLTTGRVVSIAGQQFAANAVIDSLNEKGLLSDQEAKALKALKLDKNGNNLAKAKGGKKPKKIGAIRAVSIKPVKTATFKLSAPKFKIKKTPTFKLTATKTSKPATFKVSGAKITTRSRPALTY